MFNRTQVHIAFGSKVALQVCVCVCVCVCVHCSTDVVPEQP